MLKKQATTQILILSVILRGALKSHLFLTFLQNTDLRDNLTYLKWYGMIGSTLIMVLIPAVVLIWSAFAMCMGIPEGNQRKKIVRIMIIIIAMFIICHVPKVYTYTKIAITVSTTKVFGLCSCKWGIQCQQGTKVQSH